MRFMMITSSDPAAAPPTPEAMAKLATMTEELTKAGILVDTGAIQENGVKVESDGTGITVLDGPYTESKELIAGYAIVEVKSQEEALELSRKFYEAMGGGRGEILQMFSAADMPPQ